MSKGSNMAFCMGFVFVFIITGAMACYTCGEMIITSATGEFGKIEIESEGKSFPYSLDFDIVLKNHNYTCYTGVHPTSRILEVIVYSDSGPTKDYVDYIPKETIICQIGNATLVLTSTYEPIGYVNSVEIAFGILNIPFLGFLFGVSFSKKYKDFEVWLKNRKHEKEEL